jgi:hypothetical protein
MQDEWAALEHYLRAGAELVAEAQEIEVAEPVAIVSVIEEIPA